jgi:hypothetical protein
MPKREAGWRPIFQGRSHGVYTPAGVQVGPTLDDKSCLRKPVSPTGCSVKPEKPNRKERLKLRG